MKLEDTFISNDTLDQESNTFSPEFLARHGITEKQEEEPDESNESVLEDLGTGVIAGGREAVQDVVNLGSGIMEFGYRNFDAGIRYLNPDIKVKPLVDEKVKETFNWEIPKVDQPKTTGGAFVRDATEILSLVYGVGKFMKMAKIAQGTSKTAYAGRFLIPGAVASPMALEPYEARLSNMLDKYPSLRNPITDLLRSDPSNTITEEKIFSALEAVFLDSTAGGLLKVMSKPLSAILRREKNIDNAVKAGKSPEEIQKISDDGIIETTEAIEKSQKEIPVSKVDDVVSDTFTKTELETMKAFIKSPETIPSSTEFFNTTKFDSQDTINVLEKLKESVPRIVKKGKKSLQTTGEQAVITTNDLLSDIVSPDKILAFSLKIAKDTGKADESIIALKLMVENFRRTLSKQAEGLSHTASPQAEARFLNTLSQFMELVDNVKTGITGTARATSAGRIRIGEAGGDPFKLQKMLKDEGLKGNAEAIAERIRLYDADPKKFLKEAYNHRKTGFFDVTGEVFRGSILNNVKTHVTNILSGVSENVIYPAERYVGALLTPGEKSSFRNLMVHYKAMASQMLPALRMARKSLYHEQNYLDPLATKVDGLPRHMITAERMGLKEKSVAGNAVDFLGKVNRMSLRLMGSEDEFFKQLAYRSKLYADASMEGIESGLRGKQLKGHITKRIDEAFDSNTGRALDNAGLQIARQVTFTEDLARGGLPRSLQIIVGKHPSLGLFLPFIRTPTNLFIRAYQRTPLSFAVNRMPRWRRFREEMLNADPQMKALLRGRMAIGTVLYGSALTVVLDGKVTGAGPANYNANLRWRQAGNQPYSIRYGNEWVGYNRLDPMFLPLAFMANVADNLEYMNEEQRDQAIMYAIIGFTETIQDKAYFQGIANLLEILTLDQRTDNIELKPTRVVSSMASSFIPSSYSQIRSEITGDKAFKEANSFYNKVMKKINPDLVPDKRDDITGEVILMPGYYNTGIPVIKEINDPTRDELARLGEFIPLPSKWISDNIELNDLQYSEYLRILGTIPNPEYGNLNLKQALDVLIQSPSYQTGLDEEQRLIRGYADDDPRLTSVLEIIYSYRQLAEEVLLDLPENFELNQKYLKELHTEELIQQGVDPSFLQLMN
jgi:hypothetical protein